MLWTGQTSYQRLVTWPVIAKVQLEVNQNPIYGTWSEEIPK